MSWYKFSISKIQIQQNEISNIIREFIINYPTGIVDDDSFLLHDENNKGTFYLLTTNFKFDSFIEKYSAIPCTKPALPNHAFIAGNKIAYREIFNS